MHALPGWQEHGIAFDSVSRTSLTSMAHRRETCAAEVGPVLRSVF